ncbi:MAG: cell division protein ZapA [Bacteroidales bacterium]|jgi:cell division protein ZapA|nr:cell division protein ZapA [Bacteroidales bacterium]
MNIDLNQLLPITIKVAERQYKVRVPAEEEEIFRQAVLVIKEKLDGYARLYAYKDTQDLLSMVLIEYVTQYIKMEKEQKSNNGEMITKLEQIENMFDKHLSAFQANE